MAAFFAERVGKQMKIRGGECTGQKQHQQEHRAKQQRTAEQDAGKVQLVDMEQGRYGGGGGCGEQGAERAGKRGEIAGDGEQPVQAERKVHQMRQEEAEQVGAQAETGQAEEQDGDIERGRDRKL